MSGWNQSLTLGDGNYVVSGSQGNGQLTTGRGNSTITMHGYNNVIKTGDGANTINTGDGNSTVTTGSGNNSVLAKGYNNVITTGNGVNTIVAGDGNEKVYAGDGTDTVKLSGYSNLVTGGAGHLLVSGGAGNTYQVNAVGAAGGFDIQDFSLNNGDVLDLSKVLSHTDWNHASDTLSRYLQISQSGGDTRIAMDTTGHGTSFATVATLHNVGSPSLGDLQAHHSINLF
jgi:Ca2+-binding RTX toxin-like protein